jgi:glutathione S-transferase
LAVSNQYRLYVDSLWSSPYVFSTYVALLEKQINFEPRVISLMDGEQHADAYANASLSSRVPCLESDTFSLSESSAIAEYLDEQFPSPAYPALLPSGIEPRARARQLMALLRSDLGHLRAERSTITMFYRFRLPDLTPLGKRDAEKLVFIANAVIPADASSLFGAWSLVDSELAFMLHRLLLNGYALPKRIADYAAREWSRPSVQRFVRQQRPATVPERYWSYAGTQPLPTI